MHSLRPLVLDTRTRYGGCLSNYFGQTPIQQYMASLTKQEGTSRYSRQLRQMPQKILRQTWSMSLGPIPLATMIQCFRPVLLIRRHCGPRALLRWPIRVSHRRTSRKYFRPTMMKSCARTREMIPLPIQHRRRACEIWVHHTKSTSDMAGSRRISAILVSVQPCFSLGRWRYGPAGEHREWYRRNHWTTYWDT